MDDRQKEFLNDAFLSLTVMSTLRRSKIYRDGTIDSHRAKFRAALRNNLAEVVQHYTTEVDDNRHVENIASLADDLSEGFGSILKDGRFRVGSAQKAVNLYLKYLWCTEQIRMPPHCPFDSIIISKLPDCSDLNWTELDTVKDYERLVKAARAKAGNIPLARWELETYTSG